MKSLGNVLWHFPFFGFVSAFLTFILGLLLTLTIIAAPIGLGLIQFSKFLLAPFGHEMVSSSKLNKEQNKYWKAYSTVVMILYLPFGIISCLLAAVQVIGLFLSIIGIPVALVLAKSLGTYLNPVGKVCVPSCIKEEIERAQARKNFSIKE